MLMVSLEISSFQYFEAYLTRTELAILTLSILITSERFDEERKRNILRSLVFLDDEYDMMYFKKKKGTWMMLK